MSKDDGSGVGVMEEDEIYELAIKNPDFSFVISELERPGFKAFMQELEYTHYMPDTPKNAFFSLYIVRWPKDILMNYAVFSIPKEDLERAEELARTKYGFRFAHKYRPMLLGGSGEEQWFPMELSDNVSTIQGFLKDKELVAKYDQEQKDVIDAHYKKVTEQ